MSDEPKRAPRGSVETSHLVRMSASLAQQVKDAAARENISVAEWWRRAGERWLEAWPELKQYQQGVKDKTKRSKR